MRTPSKITNPISRFANEKELMALLKTPGFLNFESTGPVYSKCEVPIGECIPDMIIVRFDRNPPSSIWPRNWSYMHAFLVWLLRKQPKLTLSTIAKHTLMDEERVLPFLLGLKKSGAITQSKTGSFQLTARLRNIEAQVIAVEAKISRWREALAQAKNYLRFADCAMVAIDPSSELTAQKGAADFRRAGVGLCTVNPDGPKWLIKPKTRRVSHPDREYILASATSESRQASWVRR